MLKAHIEFTGQKKVLEQLSSIKNGLKNLKPMFKEIAEYYIDFFSKDVYRSEGGVYGDRWAELSPKYAAYKLRKWGSQPILIASGKMSREYSAQLASDYLIISNDAKNKRGEYYAGAHQSGTARMPQRQIMKFQDKQMRKVTDIAIKSINSIIRKYM